MKMQEYKYRLKYVNSKENDADGFKIRRIVSNVPHNVEVLRGQKTMIKECCMTL